MLARIAAPAVALALLICCSCSACRTVAGLVDESVAPDSALYSLRIVQERPVGAAIVEPSDLAFDAETGLLWTVSDETGTIHRIAPDGAVSGSPLDIGGRDLEGITIDPTSGHLFVADEATSEIVEVTRDGQVVRRFKVDIPTGNRGIEGIAYDSSSDGFVLVHERSPAELVFVNRSGTVARRVRIDTEDLSGITASPSGGTFLVTARFEEAVLEVDRNGKRLNRLPLNVTGLEGLVFDERGRMFAVADLGPNARGVLYLLVRGGAS